jgi:hypothetical protein
MEQDLGSTEDAVERPNQTVTAFLLQLMQHAVLHCRDEKRRLIGSPILAVFLLWRLSIYQADCSIWQN